MQFHEALSDNRIQSFVRLTSLLVLIVSISFIGSAYFTRHDSVQGPTADIGVGDTIAEESTGTTIVTTQGSIPSVELPSSAISEPNGAIYAIGPSGNMIYKNDTYHAYFDVDPVSNANASVTYVAHEYVPKKDCGTKFPCYIRHVQTVNVTTGDVRSVYSSKVSGPANGNAGRWHDVDRYDEDKILVADIEEDSVAILNTTSGVIEWEWRAENAFPVTSGGEYTQDWTHINDVELLPDGRIMADLRNQDAVVFLTPGTGLQQNWTLGSDDNHEILFAQHNPDYIPEANGGPSVVIPDSRNDRIVEYQRINGTWEQSWIWQDTQMNWPRDADRLPNGHTLVTDSGSNRVFEINEGGEIIWSITADNPYEAERLETGDESRGGESAAQLNLESRTIDPEVRVGFGSMIKSLVPEPIVNAIIFVKPIWMGLSHIGFSIAILGVLLIWPPLELYWSKYRFRIRSFITIQKE